MSLVRSNLTCYLSSLTNTKIGATQLCLFYQLFRLFGFLFFHRRLLRIFPLLNRRCNLSRKFTCVQTNFYWKLGRSLLNVRTCILLNLLWCLYSFSQCLERYLYQEVTQKLSDPSALFYQSLYKKRGRDYSGQCCSYLLFL